MQLEREFPVHVASCSTHSVVYKVRGFADTLYKYFPDLRDTDFMSVITIGHSRYSTNTETAFERVQPFSLLGHNGEINTIARLRQEARMLGGQLVRSGSDSQDLNRSLEVLIHRYGFTLMEAMEIMFPPVPGEAEALPADVAELYRRYRMGWGPFAQGPAGLVTRYGEECVFSVDAMGLRPLWFGETEKDYYFSSEFGVVPLEHNVRDPRSLAPGEKVALQVHRNSTVKVLTDREIRLEVRRRARAFKPVHLRQSQSTPQWNAPTAPGNLDTWRTATGWYRTDRDIAETMSELGSDPIGSLGYDGPLAILSRDGVRNIAEFFKEAVAVVTNPAIDRERETEHFSTEAIIGPRPSLHHNDPDSFVSPLTTRLPVLIGGAFAGEPLLDREGYAKAAELGGTRLLEDVITTFGRYVAHLDLSVKPGESPKEAIIRLQEAALDGVGRGAKLILLDDALAFSDGHLWLDHHLALAAVDRVLRLEFTEEGKNYRRSTGLILRAAGIRNLHDLILAVALGADAVNPYLLIESSVGRAGDSETRVAKLVKLLSALEKGLQKVTSTMGVHELRGYGKTFASIGLTTELSDLLGCVNYAGSDEYGFGWDSLWNEAQVRKDLFTTKAARAPKETRIYPHLYKMAGQVAAGEVDYTGLMQRLAEIERTTPVALRHTLDFRYDPQANTDPDSVDLGVGAHSLPFIISSMSFGSQGEVAFRAYAEAAFRLDMYSLNGEGGEIKDMLGKYPNHRGQQIASGRFGVNAELINSSYLLEIKVGQGAKPGEGGHLPGKKVTVKVAAARNANVGVDLLSPSNNHDIYSIEDLAQFIEELKTSNPRAKVAVKIPVVPGIGVIAVGVAKANADIINITGYDGGTGAARQHSLKYVGLPAEIGVVEAHHALLKAGLRDRVEIWCDGGMKGGADVVKMVCMGANRVGFGTMAMVAIGCTICRKCQTDTCHVGIATQIESKEQAIAHGLKAFEPQIFEDAVSQLQQLFGAVAQEAKEIVARLGYTRLQDLVGRADLLQQVREREELDMASLLKVAERPARVSSAKTVGRALRPPRNHRTEMISNMVMETMDEGEEVITYEDGGANSMDRAIGTHLVGALVRHYGFANGRALGGTPHSQRTSRQINLNFNSSSVPGNGLAAFHGGGVSVIVEGGAQDGMGKCSIGGRVMVMKGMNHKGERVGGGVGKSFAYGAQKGLFIVQGNADSRAGVRLSGADLVIGGEITEKLSDESGFLASRANLKGFAFEYMTAGRVVVLGDPGPWMCSGMTGGVVYIRMRPELGFDETAIRRRLAKGANVKIASVSASDQANLNELLCAYYDALIDVNQREAAAAILEILERWEQEFVKVVPANQQVDQTVATE
jgi:glutamate synthase (NADPH/NADH) large chain